MKCNFEIHKFWLGNKHFHSTLRIAHIFIRIPHYWLDFVSCCADMGNSLLYWTGNFAYHVHFFRTECFILHISPVARLYYCLSFSPQLFNFFLCNCSSSIEIFHSCIFNFFMCLLSKYISKHIVMELYVFLFVFSRLDILWIFNLYPNFNRWLNFSHILM